LVVTDNRVCVTDSVTDSDLGVTDNRLAVTDNIPDFGGENCQCQHCRQNRAGGNKLTINHGPHKSAAELQPGEVNRASLPGDPDYIPVRGKAVSAAYEITGGKVYGRQAVRYNLKEQWGTRPLPDSPDDRPVIGSRGRYKRQDNRLYQIDSTGKSILL
jgi:hypothetical protein